jgi:hypothetical protein
MFLQTRTKITSVNANKLKHKDFFAQVGFANVAILNKESHDRIRHGDNKLHIT